MAPHYVLCKAHPQSAKTFLLHSSGADLRGFQGSMEFYDLHRGCLEPPWPEGARNPLGQRVPGTLWTWDPLKPSGLQKKKETCLMERYFLCLKMNPNLFTEV